MKLGEARRRPGRPRSAEPRAETRHIRFRTDADDALDQLSKRFDVPVHALVRLAADLLLDRPPEDIERRLRCISGGF